MDLTINRKGNFAGGLARYLVEGKALGKIALPLILASLVNMSISITDVVMMGWLGAGTLAAGAIVSDYYSIFFYLSSGILAATSPLIAQARGRREYRRIRNIVQQAFLIALILALPGSFIVFNSSSVLHLIGIDRQLIDTGLPYAQVMALTYVVMLFVNVLHHFLAAHQKTRIIFMVTALSMPLNALGNYVFMFGFGGIAPMGLAGAALSSLMTASFIFAALLFYAMRSKQTRRYYLLSRFGQQKHVHLDEIFRIGLPIGISNLGEMGIFLFSTVTMGIFGAEVLAAHTITLRMAGVVFAIPMGFAQATTVRVGYAIGRGEHDRILDTIKAGLLVGATLGMIVLGSLIIFASDIVRGFIVEPVPSPIMTQAVLFLTILAIGEPFTNIGSICAGALRAFKETRTPMLLSVVSYWGVAFVGGWTLAFSLGQGGSGIWLGLTAGCIVYGCLMLARLVRRFRQENTTEAKLVLATN